MSSKATALDVMLRAEIRGAYRVEDAEWSADFKKAKAREQVLERLFRGELANAIRHDVRMGDALGLCEAQAVALASLAWEEGHSAGLVEVIGFASRIIEALRAR